MQIYGLLDSHCFQILLGDMGAVERGVGLYALVVGYVRIFEDRFKSWIVDLGRAAGGLVEF